MKRTSISKKRAAWLKELCWAAKDLLSCPELNFDELEEYTKLAIAHVQETLNTIPETERGPEAA